MLLRHYCYGVMGGNRGVRNLRESVVTSGVVTSGNFRWSNDVTSGREKHLKPTGNCGMTSLPVS